MLQTSAQPCAVPPYLLLLSYFLKPYLQHGCHPISPCQLYKDENEGTESAAAAVHYVVLIA